MGCRRPSSDVRRAVRRPAQRTSCAWRPGGGRAAVRAPDSRAVVRLRRPGGRADGREQGRGRAQSTCVAGGTSALVLAAEDDGYPESWCPRAPATREPPRADGIGRAAIEASSNTAPNRLPFVAAKFQDGLRRGRDHGRDWSHFSCRAGRARSTAISATPLRIAKSATLILTWAEYWGTALARRRPRPTPRPPPR